MTGKPTGPRTPAGKARSAGNATRHGILSRELILPNEKREDFDALLGQLLAELRPYGTLESALVERIAIALWRQRRLVRAERAQIVLRQQNRKPDGRRKDQDVRVMPIGASIARSLRGGPLSARLDELDAQMEKAQDLRDLGVEEFARQLPLVAEAMMLGRAQEYAKYGGTIAQTYHEFDDAVAKWRLEIREALADRNIPALLDDARAIPDGMEILARYQSALDNDLYKAMRSLREAQAWRLKTLEGEPADAAD